MSTTPQPLFDMSKAVPIQSAPTQAAPSPSQGAAPLFDLSKAQPIQQQGISIPSNATISAQPESTGWRDSLSKWAENVSNDIKYGTDVTGVGSVLKKMGAHGVYNGNPEAVGDFMASLPLGLARTTKGAGEVTQPGQTWQGTKDIAGEHYRHRRFPRHLWAHHPKLERKRWLLAVASFSEAWTAPASSSMQCGWPRRISPSN